MRSSAIAGSIALALVLAACGETPTAPPETGVLDVPGPSAAVIVNEKSGPETIVLFDPCNGEPIEVTSTEKLIVRRTDDGAGGFLFGFSQTFSGTAVGLTSGREYQFQQTFQFSEHARPPFPETFTFNNRAELIALDTGAENLLFHVLTHVTVEATGDISSAVDEFRVVCL